MSPKNPTVEPEKAFYVAGADHIIDIARPDGRSLHYGRTLEEVRALNPGADLVLLDDAAKQARAARRAKYLTAPVPVTQEEWDYWLGCLPPDQWITRSAAETFKLAERTTDDLTRICCRVGERYWSFIGEIALSHDEIVKRCLAAVMS